MPNKLIGTGANQVPVNGMLGELAFQTKENVNFTGGTGKLSKLDLDEISTQLNVTATDIFVYDTSRDTDGGAWRNRCQHLSWYNETLNTSTRGSRKEFPSVAIIVGYVGGVTIYDGDNSELPMWMTFTHPGGGANYVGWGNNNVRSVSMLNGILAIGTSSNGGTYGALTLTHFLLDTGWCFINGASIFKFDYPITSRNESLATKWHNEYVRYTSNIVSNYVNDIDMKVLPNAPIDPTTGMAIPTIAVATNGGVSVIRDSGAVVNITHGDPNYSYSYDVNFTKDNKLRVSMDSTSRRYYRTYNIPSSAISVDQWNPASDDGVTAYVNYENGDIGHFGNITCTTENAVGTNNSLLVFEDQIDGSKTLHARIGTKFNSGWMIGSGNKCSWLSDTTTETLVGSGELVTNGTFATDVSGWTAGNGGAITYSSGKLRLTNSTAASGTATQNISTIIGKTYVVSAIVYVTTTNNYPRVYFGSSSYQVPSGVIGTYRGSFSFVATSTTTALSLNVNSGTSGVYAEYDNVSVRLAEPDRCVTGNGLQIFGYVNKTPVAPGAELVAYSGFTSSNYLSHPANPAFDFGSGSYTVALWAKATGTVTGIAVGRGTGDTAESMCVYFDTATYGVYFDYGLSSAYVFAPGAKTIVNDGQWHFYVCHVTAGQSGVIWIDGVKQTLTVGGAAPASFLNDPAWEVYIGAGRAAAQPYNGYMSLVRISSTIPTPDQIMKMYNDEKMLFLENAKASLYGSSEYITAVAFDDDKNLLHVGNSSGRSVFQGLRRVDNTTTSVSAAISAANGLVAEQ